MGVSGECDGVAVAEGVVPVVSTAQRKWMHATKPEMAKRWEAKTPKGVVLPAHVKALDALKKAGK